MRRLAVDGGIVGEHRCRPVTYAVREAVPDDADGVVRLLDAAMLEFDRERARRRAGTGDVVVAVVRGYNRAQRQDSGDAGGDDRVVGACVLADADAAARATEIESVAVHRSRRGRGIGTALVDAAATWIDGPLVARFRPAVRPFYASVGFEIGPADPSGGTDSATPGTDRLRGVLR